MSDTLSQNEIDLLFTGGENAAPAVAATDPVREVQVYDFRRPARISKDRKRSLKAMYELLAKSVESWLTGRVRDQIELTLETVEQLTFGEFMLALPSPCASYIVDVEGSGQQGVIDFGQEFAYFVVDRLLGGADRHVVPPRPMTQLERLVVRIVAERVAHQLSEVWQDYVEFDLQVTGFESIPEMLQVANREDPVLVANIGVSIGDMSSLLLLCLPFTALEKFFTGGTNRRHALPQGSETERAEDRRIIEDTVRDARIPVHARLPAFKVPVGVLAGLRPGSILTTPVAPHDSLELYVAGQRRFLGAAGRTGRHLAVRVQHVVTPEPDDNLDPDRLTDDGDL